ncbi:MAG: hypothetical protein F4W93_08215 [Dehalococcoidia bacterium]|nr:hypothetical protein [Dehalococcoidia bacterium]
MARDGRRGSTTRSAKPFWAADYAPVAKLGIYESIVRRIVDPNHRSHISQVEKALQAVGRSLVIEDRTAA